MVNSRLAGIELNVLCLAHMFHVDVESSDVFGLVQTYTSTHAAHNTPHNLFLCISFAVSVYELIEFNTPKTILFSFHTHLTTQTIRLLIVSTEEEEKHKNEKRFYFSSSPFVHSSLD